MPELLARHLEPLRDRHAFAADDASGWLRIVSRPRRDGELTVRVIHREVIEGVFGLDEDAVRARRDRVSEVGAPDRAAICARGAARWRST